METPTGWRLPYTRTRIRTRTLSNPYGVRIIEYFFKKDLHAKKYFIRLTTSKNIRLALPAHPYFHSAFFKSFHGERTESLTITNGFIKSGFDSQTRWLRKRQ